MTQKILLALALTLGSTALVAPTASACGGYYTQPTQEELVRRAIFVHVRENVRRTVRVEDVEVRGSAASARLVLEGRLPETRNVRLRWRDGAWRIVAFS